MAKKITSAQCLSGVADSAEFHAATSARGVFRLAINGRRPSDVFFEAPAASAFLRAALDLVEGRELVETRVHWEVQRPDAPREKYRTIHGEWQPDPGKAHQCDSKRSADNWRAHMRANEEVWADQAKVAKVTTKRFRKVKR